MICGDINFHRVVDPTIKVVHNMAVNLLAFPQNNRGDVEILVRHSVAIILSSESCLSTLWDDTTRLSQIAQAKIPFAICDHFHIMGTNLILFRIIMCDNRYVTNGRESGLNNFL